MLSVTLADKVFLGTLVNKYCNEKRVLRKSDASTTIFKKPQMLKCREMLNL